MSEQPLTSHEKREQKQSQQQVREQHKGTQEQHKKKKQTMGWVIFSLLIVAGLGYLTYTIITAPEPYTQGQIHWHTKLQISICDQPVDLPRSDGTDTVHGSGYVGTPTLHTHDDNTIHLEGSFTNPEDASLGIFFDAIDVPFSSTQISDTKNGDDCDGQQGKWSMLINNQPSDAWRNHIIRDGDTINLAFK